MLMRSALSISSRLRRQCLVLLMASGSAHAGATCIIDTFDEAATADWIQCGTWSKHHTPEWRVDAGAYCLGAQGKVLPPPPPLAVAAEWPAASASSRYRDGCVVARFRSGSIAAGTWRSHFVVSMRADCKEAGYKAMIGPSLGRISLYRRLRLLADSLAHSFAENTDYWVEFCAVGAALSMRYWAHGDDRPQAPQLTATDSRFTQGNIGVGVFIENDNQGPYLRGCFDEVRYLPAHACRGDVNCDERVDFGDVVALINRWGTYTPCAPPAPSDIDGDCAVGIADLISLVRQWGVCTEVH